MDCVPWLDTVDFVAFSADGQAEDKGVEEIEPSPSKDCTLV